MAKIYSERDLEKYVSMDQNIIKSQIIVTVMHLQLV